MSPPTKILVGIRPRHPRLGLIGLLDRWFARLCRGGQRVNASCNDDLLARVFQGGVRQRNAAGLQRRRTQQGRNSGDHVDGSGYGRDGRPGTGCRNWVGTFFTVASFPFLLRGHAH